ncbi:MAG: hypothetical protein JO276_06365 [Sphingomonadaceae bacterium]|nr:hypothetical protein [Sphingomonadaceae bacterium]
MRPFSLLIVVACLAGCGQQAAYNSADATEHHGRYLGIGVYPATDLWQHLTRPQRSTDPHAATLQDDTQLIVVVDSHSGEIRQCGNMSGHCIGMNPWAAALGPGQAAPVALDAHQADLDRDRLEAAPGTPAVNTTAAAGSARSTRR